MMQTGRWDFVAKSILHVFQIHFSPANMDFDLQNTYQKHIVYENMKWSHGQYEHFAPVGFHWNPDRSLFFDKSVGIHFSGNKVNF